MNTYSYDMLLNKSGIYQIRNLITQKVYIGSASTFRYRKNNHFRLLRNNNHKNKYLQNAYNKYTENNFVFEILVLCPKEYLIKMEQWFLDNTKEKYNLLLTAGSPFGRKHSEETKKKMSLSAKGNKNSVGRICPQEMRDYLSLLHKGKRFCSDEHYKKLAELCRGRKQSIESIEKMKQTTKINKLNKIKK